MVSSGHSDTNLEAFPAKSVLLSAAKRHIIRLYDENGDEMFTLSDSDGVSHSQSLSDSDGVSQSQSLSDSDGVSHSQSVFI